MTLPTSLLPSKMVFNSNSGLNRCNIETGKRGRRGAFSCAPELLECRQLLTAPVLNPNGNPTLDPINEDVSSGANIGTLVSTIITRMSPGGGITDADPGALTGMAVIGSNQTSGSWQFTTNGGGTWSDFGATSSASSLFLAANASTRIRFAPSANFNGQSGLTYIAWDQTSGTNGTKGSTLLRGGATSLSVQKEDAFISIAPVNDAPVLNPAGNPTLDAIGEDVSPASNPGTLVSTILARMNPGGISDADTGAAGGMAVIGSNQTSGTWQYTTNGGANWNNFGSTSSASALFLASNPSTKVRFLPNANYSGQPGFTYLAWDQTSGTNGTKAPALVRGGTTSLSVQKEDAFIQVTPVNDAPVVNDAGNPVLDAIPENLDPATNAGTLVSTILSRMSPGGGIFDADLGAAKGMAIIGANQSNGIWQFTTNGGGVWTNFGVTNPNSALLLAADAGTRIRFLPAADFDGTRGFTFDAWDQTSGVNGGRAVTTAPGGTSAFSINTENAFITVTNVNKAPILNAGGNLLLNSVTGIGNQGTSISELISRMEPDGGILDQDNGDPKGIAITATTQSNGKWQFSTNSGTTWADVGATGTSSALLLAGDGATRIRYVATGTFTGYVRIDFVAWDQSGGTNGTKANATTRGGSTPFSVNGDSALLIVNTAPVLNPNGTPTLNTIPVNAPESSNAGTLIKDLISSMSPQGGITDADPKAERGIAVTFASQLHGRWQYSTSSTVDWIDFGTGNINKWLLLASDETTRIRFLPKPGFQGATRLNFIAWDQTTGTNGTFVNASERGGSSPFSIATETSEIGVGTTPGGNSLFDIVIRFPDNSIPDSAKGIFFDAAARWSEIIIGDLPDIAIANIGLIDDIVIDASTANLDGLGGILGQAMPVDLRPGSFLPATAVMEFDVPDLQADLAAGTLDEVVLHEMAHALGFGTIWQQLGLLQGAGTDDPRFLGPAATAEYRSIFNTTETSVPVTGTSDSKVTPGGTVTPGTGSVDVHWREGIFRTELMTWFLDSGLPNPISRVTIASMQDLGYVVDLSAADPYSDPTPLIGSLPSSSTSQNPVVGLSLGVISTSDVTASTGDSLIASSVGSGRVTADALAQTEWRKHRRGEETATGSDLKIRNHGRNISRSGSGNEAADFSGSDLSDLKSYSSETFDAVFSTI